MEKSHKISMLIGALIVALLLSIFIDWTAVIGFVRHNAKHAIAMREFSGEIIQSGFHPVVDRVETLINRGDKIVYGYMDGHVTGMTTMLSSIMFSFFGIMSAFALREMYVSSKKVLQKKQWEWLLIIIPAAWLIAVPLGIFVVSTALFVLPEWVMIASILMKVFMPSMVLLFALIRSYRTNNEAVVSCS